MKFDKLSNKVIGLAIEVHKNLGSGLLEKTYQKCLEIELREADIKYESEVYLPIIYKNVKIEDAYRIDLLIENKLIIELKSVKEIEPIFEAQILTYMKLKDIEIGLIINFNVPILKKGIKRYVLNF